MSYNGVTVEPLPYRVSANNDRVDDTASVVFRAPDAGRDQGEHRPDAPAAPPATCGRAARARAPPA